MGMARVSYEGKGSAGVVRTTTSGRASTGFGSRSGSEPADNTMPGQVFVVSDYDFELNAAAMRSCRNPPHSA